MGINKAQHINCSKIKYLPLYLDWARWFGMRNRFPRASQSIRDSVFSHC